MTTSTPELPKYKRMFIADAREFPDPDPNMSIADFQSQLAHFIPELHNAEVKEFDKDGVHYVQFQKKVGTKGAPEEKSMFVLTDFLLKNKETTVNGKTFKDARESAFAILMCADQNGLLDSVVEVIAVRFSIQAPAIKEWYLKTLETKYPGQTAKL